MTELQRHRLREVSTTFALSYAFTGVALLFMPPSSSPLLTALTFGTIFGTTFTFAGIFGPRVRHRSFALTLILQALFYVSVIGIAFSVSMWIFIAFNQRIGLFHRDMPKILSYIFSQPFTRIAMIMVFPCMLVISGMFQIGRKLGPGVLWNWMTGRYHDPREEQRIFMFLDLKDSTRLAEQLGNIRFSELVRDFFKDLTKPVIQTSGEVSHYIGDEAVLTWRLQRGLKNANCVELFFKMHEAIEQRRDYYAERYGFIPSFKAGLHVGPVVACEVGEIKSEVVYHGDVLNTASRIQGHCNELGVDLLVSEDLLSKLKLPDHLVATPQGRFLFKGKEHEVELHAVTSALSTAIQNLSDKREPASVQ